MRLKPQLGATKLHREGPQWLTETEYCHHGVGCESRPLALPEARRPGGLLSVIKMQGAINPQTPRRRLGDMNRRSRRQVLCARRERARTE